MGMKDRLTKRIAAEVSANTDRGTMPGTYLKIGKLKLVFEMTVMYHWCMVNLTDMQWQRIRHHFPEELRPKSHPGRKPVCTRDVFEAVLWILNTGAQWPMLPQCYPNYKTVHRRFQNGCRQGVVREVLMDLAQTLHEQGGSGRIGGFHRWPVLGGQGWRCRYRPHQAR